jgi:hypothetical protein
VLNFSRETYLHDKAHEIGNRRPVLLYGDSFAETSSSALSFQEILNGNEGFSKNHYLLNYGVGGYGVDQIYLLMKHSLHQYKQPFVVFSLMTLDLDRSILSVRTGQKPRFHVVDQSLELSAQPIYPNPDDFFNNHPPQIGSYLYRAALQSGILPTSVSAWLRGDQATIEKKKELNALILSQALKELKNHNIDFIFLVFHPHIPGISSLDKESDWRDPFLRNLFQRFDVPYIWSKDLIKDLGPMNALDYSDYMGPDGHPTTLFNTIIAERIQEVVLGQEGNRFR